MHIDIYKAYQNKTIQFLKEAHIVLSPEEANHIEVADFNLNQINEIGLQIMTYINTPRVCAKELVLFPNQTCPEHKHPTINGVLGKEETFRCRKGEVYLYVEGPRTPNIKAKLPNTKVTVFHEVVLKAGEQYTIYPDTLHWFQAGDEGAIISEFSTTSTDDQDIFTDQAIQRATQIEAKP